jgi:hypothetical protein
MENQIVNHATLVEKVIKSAAFKTVSMAEAYRRVAKKTGLDFDATIQLMESFPIFVDGDNHRKIRRFMAKQVVTSSGLQVERLQIELTRIFQTIIFPPNEIEIVSQIAKPLWRAIASAIWPTEESIFELAFDIPLLLCPTLSLKERLYLNGRIDCFRTRDNFGEDDLVQLCLAAAGARTFVGSIVLSLYETALKNPDVRASALAWSRSIPSSALKYVDRICVRETEMGPLKFSVGIRARLITQDPAYSEEEITRMFFGLGTHSCVGRAISETAWRLLTTQLVRSDVALVPISIRMSEHDEPFSIPIEATVSIR